MVTFDWVSCEGAGPPAFDSFTGDDELMIQFSNNGNQKDVTNHIVTATLSFT